MTDFKLIITSYFRDVLISSLEKHLNKEIGGIILGEQIGKNEFRIFDIYIQKESGNENNFERCPIEANRYLDTFYERTDIDFKQVGYIGEWHSHPLYPLIPSSVDDKTMRELFSALENKIDFTCLLLVKLINNKMHARLYIYTKNAKSTGRVYIYDGNDF